MMIKEYLKQSKKSREIKALLVLKGISGAEIARGIGVHRTAIYHTIEGKIKSYRIRKAIADALEVEYEELWGAEE